MTVRKPWLMFASIMAVVLLVPALAGAGGYEWRDHQRPFDHLFENHIDTHQQSKLTGSGGLTGFLYITPTGDTNEDGIVIAKHGDCGADPDGCTVGWVMHGLAATAEYCGHVSGEHPAWALDPELMPAQRGFTHFHWQGEPLHHEELVAGDAYSGQLLKLTAVGTFVFDHHGQFVVTPGIDSETHDNVFASCEEWAASQGGGGGHEH